MADVKVIRLKALTAKEAGLRIGDDEIKQLLRPLTIFQRCEKAYPLLSLIEKYGELPSNVIVKAFGNHNLASTAHVPMSGLLETGYITVDRRPYRRNNANYFKITPKGRQALKQEAKRRRAS
jgi:hypothetical protein